MVKWYQVSVKNMAFLSVNPHKTMKNLKVTALNFTQLLHCYR